MENYLPYIFLMAAIIIFGLWLNKKDIERIKNWKWIQNIKAMSFWGLMNDFKKYDYSYSIKTYTSQALIFGLLCTVIVYSTLGNITYTLILVSIIVFIIPYLNFLHCLKKYNDLQEKQVYTYSTYCLIFLKENRQATKILVDCKDLSEYPLSQDLEKVIEEIKEFDVRYALSNFEKKYRYESVKKVNNLLLSKSLEGVVNSIQYDTVNKNIEQSEILYNQYKDKKEAKKMAFYFAIVLNLLVSSFLKSFFLNSISVNTQLLEFYYFMFYLVNILLVIAYEHWFNHRIEVL